MLDTILHLIIIAMSFLISYKANSIELAFTFYLTSYIIRDKAKYFGFKELHSIVWATCLICTNLLIVYYIIANKLFYSHITAYIYLCIILLFTLEKSTLYKRRTQKSKYEEQLLLLEKGFKFEDVNVVSFLEFVKAKNEKHYYILKLRCLQNLTHKQIRCQILNKQGNAISESYPRKIEEKYCEMLIKYLNKTK